MNDKTPRERLGSRLGFILLSAGCAIGVGNVWKFPTVAGKNGGALFVLIYLLFLAIMGIPVLTMEFSMGRAAQKSPVKMYHALTPKKKGWRIHGYLCLAGNVILMMFYTCVTAWMLRYFVYTASGKFSGLDKAGVEGVFGEMLGEPWMMILFVAIVVIIGFGVCAIGVQKGLERVSKVMMIALLAIMAVLAVNSLTLDGAGEGLTFYLRPDLTPLSNWESASSVIVAAMNQAFFTLSLGIGSMAIFGSFIGKDRALMGEAINVTLLDTSVAFISGLIIFPACFTYGVDVAAGPALIFQTLPHVFNNMWGGRVWGSLFFVFMSFAALSTVLAVFQNILSCTEELFGWSKKKACLIDGISIFLLAIPCILGYNVWSAFQPFGNGSAVLDLEDYIVSNILLPLGALIVVLFCTWNKHGWGWSNFMAEANTGKGIKLRRWMRIYMKYVLPIIIGVILVVGIVTPFLPK